MPVYTYGVVEVEHRPPRDLVGVGGDDSQVRLLELGPVAVAISDLGAAEELTARDVMTHKRVVEELFEGGPILPHRFGMVSPDEATLRRELSRRSRSLASALRSLRERDQWEVIAHYDEESLLSSVVAGHPELRRLSTATAGGTVLPRMLQLGEMAAAELERRRLLERDRLLRRLAPLAVDVADRPAKPGTIMRASFLLDRARLPRFEQTLAEVQREMGDWLELETTGPLPPYSFVGEPERSLRAG